MSGAAVNPLLYIYICIYIYVYNIYIYYIYIYIILYIYMGHMGHVHPFLSIFHIWVWVKIRYPNHWMVNTLNTKLDITRHSHLMVPLMVFHFDPHPVAGSQYPRQPPPQ